MQELVKSNIPNWNSIRENLTQPICVSIDSQNYFEELECFNNLVKATNIDQLIARYPLLDSPIFKTIATTLRCKNEKDYQRMVLARIREDKELVCKLKNHIDSLPEILDSADLTTP